MTAPADLSRMGGSHLYDCIVVGGRVAGAATAIRLAQHGCNVMLLDRERHPSPTLSTHVFGDWEAFARLGVTERLLSAGAPRLTRFRNDVEGCVTEADMLVTPFVLGLRRERLDMLLIEQACSYPCVDWREGTSVVELLREGDRVTGVVVRGQDGRLEPLHARVVIGADGRRSKVARDVRAETYLERPEVRCAYYAHFAHVTPLSTPAFEYYWWGRDAVLVIPCDAGLHCICVMPPQEEFATWRQAPAERLEERLRSIRTLSCRLEGAERMGPVQGSGTLGSYLRQSFGPGWALVGDAGAAVHPCIGAGIDHAVVSAGLLADRLHGHFQGGFSWDEAMAGYQAARDALVLPVLEAAIRLAERRPVAWENIAWLRLLMTLPGVSHDLGEKVTGVLRELMGEEALPRLRALLESLPGEAGAERSARAG